MWNKFESKNFKIPKVTLYQHECRDMYMYNDCKPYNGFGKGVLFRFQST